MTRRKDIRPKRSLRRAILIVTNGRITEGTYLSEMKSRSKLQNAKITIRYIGGAPLNLISKLTSPEGDTTAYSEVWIVVDEDGTDQTAFLEKCKKLYSETRQWYAVISRPCFEVWLIAHYEQIKNYATQDEAQRHLKKLYPRGTPDKSIPNNFPYSAVTEAIGRCQLRNEELGQVNSMPPMPGTAMPHLVTKLQMLA